MITTSFNKKAVTSHRLMNHMKLNDQQSLGFVKSLTVFGLGEDRAVFRAVIQNHARSKQVWAALQLDAGFPAEVCHAVCCANYFHCSSVTLSLVPDKEDKESQEQTQNVFSTF